MNKTSTTISIILVIVVAILLNSISSNMFTKIDFTENKQYTLSEGTKKIIGKLKEDVTLKLYMSNLTGSNKANLNDVESHKKNVLEFLEQYPEVSNKMKLDVILVEPDSEEEDTAIRYGLFGSPIGEGVKFYIGLVAISNIPEKAFNNEVIIPFISPDPSFMASFEYEVTKIIVEAINVIKPKIGVISHFPVMGVTIPPQMQQYNQNMKDQKPWAFIQSLQYIYEFVEIPKDTPSLDTASIQGLIVIHPKDLPLSTLYSIDQYLLKGGKLIVFTDEISVFDNPPQNDQNAYAYKRSSQLDLLTDAWGLKRIKDSVLCDKNLATEVSYPNASGVQEAVLHPTLLTAEPKYFKTDSRVTMGLQNLIIYYSGVYDKIPKEGLNVEEIVFTSKQNSEIMTFQVMSSEPSKIQALCDKIFTEKGTRDPKGLVFKATGKFTTAFPEGKPKAEVDPKAPAAPEATDNTVPLKDSTGNPIAVLVTDVDMLNDKIMFRQNQFGQTTNSNYLFIQNLVEMTMGNEDLISIRTKAVNNRPFTVLEDIRKKAEENTQKEIKAYQDKAEEANKELSNLQFKTENGQLKITLTPEQMEQAKKLREQMAETRKQIRKLQYQQRKDVENKVFNCKMFNYLFFPLLISFVGLSVMLYQNRRVRKNG